MIDKRTLLGIIALGSLWGFSECIIGAWLKDAGLPSGGLMTAIFAIGILTYSKTIFPRRGVQLGIGLVAGTLRLFNPFGGCFICSAIAIMGEGAIFELLWIKISSDYKEIPSVAMQSCLGIISSYTLYVGGYLITQALTPILTGVIFNTTAYISFIPQIFARGLLPAIIGAFTIPAVLALTRLHITLKDASYYRVTTATAAASWLLVIINTLILLKL